MEGDKGNSLKWYQRLAYGLGHVQNELFGATWFSYLLLYLQFVMKLPETTAGLIFMIGQFCDGFLTPIIAHETDRFYWDRYGKRKTMHLIGSVVVSFTFPFVFTRCYGCENAPQWLLLLYFIPLICLFQFGWATVQVSHLSLIPELTADHKERDELNIIRYALNVFTDAMVYVITFLVLTSYISAGDLEDPIGPDEAFIFRDIAFILLGIGVVFTAIFHIFTPEKPGRVAVPQESSLHSMQWKDWFRVGDFYKVCIIFATSRVITNLLQVFVPLYLQEGTKAPQELIAIIPLVINMSGFSASLVVKPIIKVASKKSLFLCASAITMMSCIWFASDNNDKIRAGDLYVIAILGGAGGSTMLVLALSFTADLIGTHTGSGGFVYGCMAVTDKVTNGITILLLQIGKGVLCPDCEFYYKDVLCYGVGFFVLVNVLTMVFLPSSNFSPNKFALVNGFGDDSGEDGTEKLLDDDTESKGKYGAMRTGFPIFTRPEINPVNIPPLQTKTQ